jgi:hypothetical protein
MEHPVDGVSGSPVEKDGKPEAMKVNFYMTAVPSYFSTGKSKYHVYQLVTNFEVAKSDQENILMFNFEFSPITENVTKNHKNPVDFLISICAIIGGIYTIAAIIDCCLH